MASRGSSQFSSVHSSASGEQWEWDEDWGLQAELQFHTDLQSTWLPDCGQTELGWEELELQATETESSKDFSRALPSRLPPSGSSSVESLLSHAKLGEREVEGS